MKIKNCTGQRLLNNAVKRISGRCAITSYLLCGKSRAVTILKILSLFLVITFAGCGKPSYDTEKLPMPSYGTGQYEVIIFTDYFCPSCQSLESELDPILNKLLEKGDIKITFVDAPVHKLTQLYGKYFLYVVNANPNFKDILYARKVLFSIAKANVVTTEENLASELKAQGVTFQPYDLSKVYITMNEMMKNHDIRSTPTCVVKYSNSDIRKYMGPDDIKRALLLLLSAQKSGK
ncbi:MAG: thioredoxin domain-containing protein [Syntrophaceae bacterium]